MLFKQVMTTSFGVGDHRGHNSFSGWTIFGMLRLLSYRQGKVGGGGGAVQVSVVIYFGIAYLPRARPEVLPTSFAWRLPKACYRTGGI